MKTSIHSIEESRIYIHTFIQVLQICGSSDGCHGSYCIFSAFLRHSHGTMCFYVFEENNTFASIVQTKKMRKTSWTERIPTTNCCVHQNSIHPRCVTSHIKETTYNSTTMKPSFLDESISMSLSVNKRFCKRSFSKQSISICVQLPLSTCFSAFSALFRP